MFSYGGGGGGGGGGGLRMGVDYFEIKTNAKVENKNKRVDYFEIVQKSRTKKQLEQETKLHT